ncbi:MAG: carbamate kinase [Candidatus Nanopelagicales bacterium]
MRVVVALGGNALQKRGEPMTVENQRENVRTACRALSPVAMEHELVISHGNGPQVGLLSLQASSYDEASTYPFDVLGAQTEGMIGYFIEQELGNFLPYEKSIATILTMTLVDADDPAMADPTKFVGPVYSEEDAKRLAEEKGWTVKQDGDKWRRVVPSPVPMRIFEIRPIKALLDLGAVVVCTGGGGIPTMYLPGDTELEGPWDFNEKHLVGVEAVIDKDRSSAVLAQDLEAELLVIATDADAVYLNWGTPEQKAIFEISPDDIEAYDFPAGSMGPKVEAAAEFARRNPGRVAVIGALEDLPAIMAGQKGTRITTDAGEASFH